LKNIFNQCALKYLGVAYGVVVVLFVDAEGLGNLDVVLVVAWLVHMLEQTQNVSLSLQELPVSLI
jgi:hypothetical protein